MVITSDEIEAERPYLFGLAYRLLGSVADAEDVVQEAFVRAGEISEPHSAHALLRTIVTRLCLDEVRSARRKRTDYVGPWLPEPILTDEPSADERTIAAQSVSMAFLVLLESLSPLERAVFVLREVLDHDFADIAEAVGRTEAACRQLLKRARDHVAERPNRYPAPPNAQHRLTAAFFAAIATSDYDGLLRVLTDDVVAVSDHGGKARSHLKDIHGSDRVARLMLGLYRNFRPGRAALPAWLNGGAAAVVFEHGRLIASILLEIVDIDGEPRVAAIRTLVNPDKLARLEAAMRRKSSNV